jgi:putative ATP-dependent endonuclease of OLD family
LQFLQEKASEPRSDSQNIQIIVSSHSPNLASAIDLNKLVLLQGGKAFPLSFEHTQLDRSDYGFLARFLDVTKANMFFARGLLIVEGDAENLLIPTLARLLGRDFTENGVSIVNVGGTGLRRFARIYQRRHPDRDGVIDVPVVCVADFDVMPDCAPEILGRVKSGELWPDKAHRRWRTKSDFTPAELDNRRAEIRAKASGQRVETFVSDQWTLEYDLAFSGLAEEVWIAANLAKADEQISAGKAATATIIRDAIRSFAALTRRNPSKQELATRVYALFIERTGVSKATAAQYLACFLEARHRKGHISAPALRAALPQYIVNAIDYATVQNEDGAMEAGGSHAVQQNEVASRE